MQKLYLVKLFEKGKNLWEWVGKGVFATTCTLHNLAGVSQILATTKIEHRNLRESSFNMTRGMKILKLEA